ncbi:MAG: NPCBM/NEW2 domain-containing protein, partial [Patescibacteria group bacterium]|nr:NPCBM/NEW2 domain-containing protein [Patescibacteria group bacterium]
QWSVQTLAFSEQFRWTTPSAVTVSQPAEAVTKIDFSAGKVVYLADAEPQSVDWQAFFPMDTELASRREFFRPRRNRGFDSEHLELGGSRYTRGLALHSRTEVVYRLPEGGTHLHATAGIDDRLRPHGNVLLVIRGDGKTLYEETLTGTTPPVELDLDIAGVRRLSILCDFGEGMDIADQLNLCNLRVVK